MSLQLRERKADLHLHSTCSDGLWPPDRVVERAARAGVAVMALTDHDTVAGLDEAARAASRHGLDVVPGVEISVDCPGRGERHLLAYGIDPSDAALSRALDENRASRSERLQRMVEALNGVGVRITAEDVLECSAGSVGRPHVADALVRAGRVRSRQEAFDRWLADGRPAHVPKQNVDAARAIALVHAAGGVAVLAHPGRRWDPALVEELVGQGLDGLEAWHPANSASQSRQLEAAALRWGLLVTGGSDCHGDADGETELRNRRLPLEVAERLLQRVALRARDGARP